MQNGATPTATALNIIDRKKVRLLVSDYNDHLTSLMATGVDVYQASVDHMDQVSNYMAALNECDRRLFAQLYEEELVAAAKGAMWFLTYEAGTAPSN